MIRLPGSSSIARRAMAVLLTAGLLLPSSFAAGAPVAGVRSLPAVSSLMTQVKKKGVQVKKNVHVNRNVVVKKNIYVVRPVRVWRRKPYYGNIFAGVALGTLIGVAIAGTAPVAPAPNLCWYWTSPAMVQGYWDYCY